MSLSTERIAIETYFTANWTLTPYGLDGQPWAPPLDTTGLPLTSVRLTIGNGAIMQSSLGRTQNVYANMGVLMFQVFCDGGLGSSIWRPLADALMDLFRGKVLDPTGAIVTSGAQTKLVRFSPPEAAASKDPYIAAQTNDPPFRIVNINCPFVRYELY